MPYWGPATSSVDWCEANYATTDFVAEPFNTVSSLAMVLVGLFGMVRHRRLPVLYRVAFALLALVGVGSVAFHGTLRFELQMLDELPMLYLVLVIVYALTEPGRLVTAALVAHAILLTVLASTTRGQVQFYVFQISFGSLEFFALGKTYLLQRRAPDHIRRLYRRGMLMYAIAIAVWFTDTRFCHVMQALPVNPQLHAVWHVLVSGGFYALLLVIAAQKTRPPSFAQSDA